FLLPSHHLQRLWLALWSANRPAASARGLRWRLRSRPRVCATLARVLGRGSTPHEFSTASTPRLPRRACHVISPPTDARQKRRSPRAKSVRWVKLPPIDRCVLLLALLFYQPAQ